jgi:aminotransferase
MTVGASGALACAIDVLLDPGDELILFEPYYGYHYNIAKLRGATIRMVRTHSPTWEIDFDQLEATINDRTKAILVCTPSNPSGKVFSRAELERIGEISQRHDLLVITDEVYEYIVFDGQEHISMASLPGMAERTITIGAATKTFFVTGWRIGWAAGPAEIIGKMANASDLNYICPPSPNQKAIADALRLPQSYFDDLTRLFLGKRNKLVSALEDAGIKPSCPTGAYYIMADYKSHGWKSDEEARDALINTIGIGSVTGNSFYGGTDPSGLLRFCFAIDDDSLDEACKRLRSLRK